MNREKIKKLITATLCVFLVVGALLSAMFTSVRHEHDHNGLGGSCAVCVQQLTVSGDFLKLLSVALVGAAVGLGLLAAQHTVLRTAVFRADFAALIRLKTRMNN